jgi:hypothetical protein
MSAAQMCASVLQFVKKKYMNVAIGEAFTYRLRQ